MSGTAHGTLKVVIIEIVKTLADKLFVYNRCFFTYCAPSPCGRGH